MSKSEALKLVAARLFRGSYSPSVHNGIRILEARLEGPALKSYWPNKVIDVVSSHCRAIASEIPIVGKTQLAYSSLALRNFRTLPMNVSDIYSENINEWRRRRGSQVKKGT